MSIYTISFEQKAVELLPPDKRTPTILSWIRSLYAPISHDNYQVFVDYKTGSSYPLWVAGTYSVGYKTQYGQSVYESIIDGNTLEPTDVAGWRIYEDYFVGVDERILYNHIKLTLEYSLNKRFSSEFRQPPSVSDIYIDNNTPPFGPFVVGAIEEESSIVYLDTSSDWIIDGYSFATFWNFTVYVPTAIYEAVSATAGARESIFRFFIDKYNTAGLNYNIVTY